MGVVEGISAREFPRQGVHLGKEVDVVFNYNTSIPSMRGTIIRNDDEAPGETIILLDDGRVVRDAECQYSISLRNKYKVYELNMIAFGPNQERLNFIPSGPTYSINALLLRVMKELSDMQVSSKIFPLIRYISLQITRVAHKPDGWSDSP